MYLCLVQEDDNTAPFRLDYDVILPLLKEDIRWNSSTLEERNAFTDSGPSCMKIIRDSDDCIQKNAEYVDSLTQTSIQ